MLKIGVQSKGILDSERLNLADGFEQIKNAGFDCIDLNLDVFLKNSELYQGEMNQFFEQDTGAPVSYTHLVSGNSGELPLTDSGRY